MMYELMGSNFTNPKNSSVPAGGAHLAQHPPGATTTGSVRSGEGLQSILLQALLAGEGDKLGTA